MQKIVKRSRQFCRALFARLDPNDRALIDKYLNPKEKALFDKVDPAVQKHCANTAHTVLALAAQAPAELPLLVKAALLHDVGKVKGSFSVMQRVWYVLLKKTCPGLTAKLASPGRRGPLAGLRYAIHVHLTHAESGAALARQAGLEEELVDLIRHHDSKTLAKANDLLALLRKADELN